MRLTVPLDSLSYAGAGKQRCVETCFLTHLNDGVKVVTIERSRILDNVQKFRQEISLALQIDDDSLRDKTGESLKKPVPFGHHHAGKYTLRW